MPRVKSTFHPWEFHTDVCVSAADRTAVCAVCRVSLISSQDSGSVSKPSGVCSPAVALPLQSYYPNSSVSSPAARFGVTNYIRGGLPYKQVDIKGTCVVFSCLFAICRLYCSGFIF